MMLCLLYSSSAFVTGMRAANAVEFLHKFHYGFFGDGRFDISRSRKRSCAAPERKARTRSVGVAFVFAQIHIDTSRKLSAQNGIHHLKRKVIGIVTRHTDLSDADDRLRRAGFVNDVNSRFVESFCVGVLIGRNVSGFPIRQMLFRVSESEFSNPHRRRRSKPHYSDDNMFRKI